MTYTVQFISSYLFVFCCFQVQTTDSCNATAILECVRKFPTDISDIAAVCQAGKEVTGCLQPYKADCTGNVDLTTSITTFENSWSRLEPYCSQGNNFSNALTLQVFLSILTIAFLLN